MGKVKKLYTVIIPIAGIGLALLAIYLIIIGFLYGAFGSDTPRTMSKKESGECLQMVRKILSNNEFRLVDYAILDDRPNWLFMLQYRNNQGSYYEETGNIIKYYKNGKAYIVENNEQRDDNGFDFDPYREKFESLYGLIKTTVFTYDTNEFTAYVWSEISDPHPARVYIKCDLRREDMDILDLGSVYEEFQLGIEFDREKKEIKYFEVYANSNDNTNKLEMRFGKLDINLVMPYPE
jgi:hypothetical protein